MTKVFNKKTAKRAVSVVLLLLIVFSSIFVLPITAAAKSYTISFDYCYDTSNNIIKFVKKTTNDGYVVGEVNCTPGMAPAFLNSEKFRDILSSS